MDAPIEMKQPKIQNYENNVHIYLIQFERNKSSIYLVEILGDIIVICKVKQMKLWDQSQTLSLWELTQSHPSFLNA